MYDSMIVEMGLIKNHWYIYIISRAKQIFVIYLA